MKTKSMAAVLVALAVVLTPFALAQEGVLTQNAVRQSLSIQSRLIAGHGMGWEQTSGDVALFGIVAAKLKKTGSDGATTEVVNGILRVADETNEKKSYTLTNPALNEGVFTSDITLDGAAAGSMSLTRTVLANDDAVWKGTITLGTQVYNAIFKGHKESLSTERVRELKEKLLGEGVTGSNAEVELRAIAREAVSDSDAAAMFRERCKENLVLCKAVLTGTAENAVVMNNLLTSIPKETAMRIGQEILDKRNMVMRERMMSNSGSDSGSDDTRPEDTSGSDEPNA